MEFREFDRTDQHCFAPYFEAQKLHIADFSRAFLFMWQKALKPKYAIVENCLVLKEMYAGKCYFHYPLSRTGDREEETRAIAALEDLCRDRGERLHFTNVPKSRIADMVCRYGTNVLVSNRRKWRDYLYRAEDFKEYAGSGYAGQRNHVRKFKKLYPDWRFFEASPSDMGAVEEFLHRYEAVQRSKENRIAEEEMDEVYALLPHLEGLGLKAGILTAGGEIVGFSAGELCGDMMVIHIEKALRGYEGAYPTLAQEFARAFAGDAKYVNRMDDAGDLGLRKSKLQYRPAEIVDKYNVTPRRPIDLLSSLPVVKSERLVLRAVEDGDVLRYAALAGDVVRNRYWGYDWRADHTSPAPEVFLKDAREDFAGRREVPLGIYLGQELAGEAVVHRFGYRGEAEIGVRLFEEYEGQGIAAEAVRAYTDHAFSNWDLGRMEAKCFRENERSHRMLLSAGMRECGADGTYFYFFRTPEM